MQLYKHEDGKVTIIREHWYQYLYLRLPDVRRTISMSQLAPKFFLPVGQDRLSGQMECWILPLAPFAMIYTLANHAFKSVWFDLVELNLILQEWVDQKRK